MTGGEIGTFVAQARSPASPSRLQAMAPALQEGVLATCAVSAVRTPRQRGFTLFEFLIVIMIISMLGVVALDRLLYYRVVAEKTVVEQTVGTIRSALHLQLANYLVRDRARDIPALSRDNPMNWLAEKPPNYVGEYFDPKPGDIAVGNWYFDMRNRYLVYLVKNGEYFVPAREGAPKWVRYRVKMIYNEADKRVEAGGAKNSAATVDTSNIGGVVLEPVEPGKWKTN